MLKDQTLLEIEEWAQQKLSECEAGHDWWHIIRVRNNAKLIHKKEGGDWNAILLAVILHDIADTKFFDEVEALMLIEQKLNEKAIEQNTIDHVIKIIQNLSFSKQWSDSTFSSLELQIVQDADRLDAMGAIGIARAFSYGGHKGRDFYNPEISPQKYSNASEYRNSNSPTINHFYEKLLLLKDKMKTNTGKKMANERHRFMESYLEQFFNEWGETD
ncbi:HD domain-containing protein [Carboxylicivirga sp. A043]|uniref:HD domain-containing protein n=1 Tax=Carboxylicivirga litoralis TaxID=2816963 RepID=UPI0021CB38DF|nr:HD domain-containing protein [Carboxylicivirga sp. A043]MCU4156551.1 HD domain-containing protein [Carboxylicivirga sp. A043]